MAESDEVTKDDLTQKPDDAGPDLLALPRWEQERALFQQLCVEALNELRADSSPEFSEPDLNRRLCRMFNRVKWIRERAGSHVSGQIVPEAKCLPNLRRERVERREGKIPDFSYRYTDTQQPSDYSAMEVVAECKRLGKAERNRDFNKLYVDEGILRFKDPDHGYAATSPSAFMIGYVQTMEPTTVKLSVNANCSVHSLGHLVLNDDGWQASGVSMLHQNFYRSDPAGQFELRHLWLDLRGSNKVRLEKSGTAKTRNRPKKKRTGNPK